MARMVATKAALSIRVDALTDSDGKSEDLAASIGVENRAKLESRLRALEHQSELGITNQFSQNNHRQQARFSMGGETKTYNTKSDLVDFVSTQREDPMEAAVQAVLDAKEEKKKAKEERKAKKSEKAKEKQEDQMNVDEVGEQEKESKEDKKEKKRKRRESDMPPTAENEPSAKVSCGRDLCLSP
jgi:nucleolar protein 58